MYQASKMYIRVRFIMEKNLHTDTRINMAVLKSNNPVDGRLAKIEVGNIKVNMDLAIITKNPSLFPV